jgi:excisionase family DNA binding protein
MPRGRSCNSSLREEPSARADESTASSGERVSDEVAMSSENDDQRLWDARDVARYFGASRSWVYHQAESGMLPHVRIGGLLRFHPDEIRAFARGKEPRRQNVLPLATKNSR